MRLGPQSTRNNKNGHSKRMFSKTLSKVDILENAVYLFTCGQRKRIFL